MAQLTPDQRPVSEAEASVSHALQSPFDDLLGLVYETVGPDRLAATVVAGPRHHQPFGIVHGGVYATIVETLASVGAYMRVRDDGKAAVGVHNATDFIRSHVEGRLRAVAEPVHLGRSQHLWQVVITRDIDSKTVARGQVRLAIIPADGDEKKMTSDTHDEH